MQVTFASANEPKNSHSKRREQLPLFKTQIKGLIHSIKSQIQISHQIKS